MSLPGSCLNLVTSSATSSLIRLAFHSRGSSKVAESSSSLYFCCSSPVNCRDHSGSSMTPSSDTNSDTTTFLIASPFDDSSHDGYLHDTAGQVGRHPPKGGYYCGPGGDPRGRPSRRPRSVGV